MSEYEAKGYNQGDLDFLRRNQIPTTEPDWSKEERARSEAYAAEQGWEPTEYEPWENLSDPTKAQIMREEGPYDEREYVNPNAVMMPPVRPVPPAPTYMTETGEPASGPGTGITRVLDRDKPPVPRNPMVDPRMYRSFQENIRLMADPRMHPPMGGMPIGVMPPLSNEFTSDPYEGLSGQEYAEKHNIPYAKGGRASYTKGGLAKILGV